MSLVSLARLLPSLYFYKLTTNDISLYNIEGGGWLAGETTSNTYSSHKFPEYILHGWCVGSNNTLNDCTCGHSPPNHYNVSPLHACRGLYSARCVS